MILFFNFHGTRLGMAQIALIWREQSHTSWQTLQKLRIRIFLHVVFTKRTLVHLELEAPSVLINELITTVDLHIRPAIVPRDIGWHNF